MDVLEAILRRRSVRKFKDEKLKKEEIGELLKAARWAPSAGNTQPWEIIVVRDDELKEELAEIALEQSWMEDAPVILVVCVNEELAGEERYGQRGIDLWGVQATGALIQNILLRATELGLGACWVGAFDEDQATVVLGCEGDDDIRPVAMVPVGKPKDSPEATPRRIVNSFTHIDRYGEKDLKDWKGLKRYMRKARRETEKFLKSLRERRSDPEVKE